MVDQSRGVYLTLEVIKQFSKTVHFHTPTSSVWELQDPLSLSVFGIITHFNFSHSSRYVLWLAFSLPCCLLSSHDVESISCEYWPFLYHLLRSVQVLCPFFLTLFPFSYWPVAVVRYMYYSGFLPLCDVPVYFTTNVYFNKNENNMLTLMKIHWLLFSLVLLFVFYVYHFLASMSQDYSQFIKMIINSCTVFQQKHFVDI